MTVKDHLHKSRVLVAMSGGVDSSLTAALLQQRGYEVIGVTMQIWPDDTPPKATEGGCCSLSAVEDARRVAAELDIPYYVLNFADVFSARVIEYFCREYGRGRTPNPCIVCNHEIKFKSLLKKAFALGAWYLATGHYARIEYDGWQEKYTLKKGIDDNKDQSYALYGLTQKQLAHALMPLGSFKKEATRRLAERFDLPVHDKPDSQEICFIPNDDYHDFIRRRMPSAVQPGPILDTAGRKLGEHSGLPFYTIGQRRGLGISANEPLYVVALDHKRNAVVVGSDAETYGDKLRVQHVNLIHREIDGPQSAEVKIRYNSPPAPATLYPPTAEGMEIAFHRPVRAITPGQAAVAYSGDVVLGGGVIAGKREVKSAAHPKDAALESDSSAQT